MNGTKNKEYRAISPNTITRYLMHQKVDGELQLLYYPDLISEVIVLDADDYVSTEIEELEG